MLLYPSCVRYVLFLIVALCMHYLCFPAVALLFCVLVERVSLGQEEKAPVPAPFEWDPSDE